MKVLYLQLTIALTSLALIQGCEISFCSVCSEDNIQCKQCANGYVLDQNNSKCSEEISESSPNVGLIVGLTVAIVFGILVSYIAYKKCVSSNKHKSSSSALENQQTYTYGGNFGCMGMVDPINCFTYQYQTTTMCQDKDEYYYNVQIYNKFKNLNEKCLDNKNDCDKCAFKLDRKENLFPDWSSKEFTKFIPLNPSKKEIKHAKFSCQLTLIPLNVLEMSAEELKQVQSCPIYEPIKKHSVDDSLKLQKQESSESQKFCEEGISQCSFKVRSSSIATECPSNTGDDVATEEVFSQESFDDQCPKKIAKKNVSQNTENAITINIEQIQQETACNQMNKCEQNSCKNDKQKDCVIIQIQEQNILLNDDKKTGSNCTTASSQKSNLNVEEVNAVTK